MDRNNDDVGGQSMQEMTAILTDAVSFNVSFLFGTIILWYPLVITVDDICGNIQIG